jgi:hypothetical protein
MCLYVCVHGKDKVGCVRLHNGVHVCVRSAFMCACMCVFMCACMCKFNVL